MTQRAANLIDQFTDYRRFIVEALERRGRRRTELAEALGLSDSMLSQVLSKKRRLRASLVGPLAEFFELSEDERHMLAALVDLDNESAFARQTAWATVQARQRYLAEAVPSEHVIVGAFSRWFVPAIYELARCEDFQADPAWIARVLNPPISAGEAEEALQTLLQLGMLQPSEQGQLKPVSQEVWADGKLPPGAASKVVFQQHLRGLELAKRSYKTFESNERHNGVITFSLSEERYEQILAKTRQLERELVVLSSVSDPSPSNRVYQLCLNLFPLSDYTDD